MARLARLHLDDAEAEAMRDELGRVLDHVASLQAIDVEGVEPLTHPRPMAHRLADDVVEPSPTMDGLLIAGPDSAPQRDGLHIAVPPPLPPADQPDRDAGQQRGVDRP